MRRSLLAPVLVIACGCSSQPGETTPSTAFDHDYVFTMNETVPAGTELHQCQFVQIPAGSDINVTRFAHQYTAGSHHFLLYLTDLMSIPSDLTGQYDCTNGNEPILAHAKGVIYGGQVPEGDVSFPSDVAMTLQGGQVLVMNTHFLNTTTSSIDTTVKVGFDTIPASQVKVQGGFFIFYDPFIDIPAAAKASSGERCYVGSDVNVVSAFTHYHFRGTGMSVYEDVAGQPVATTPFYATDDWEHPESFPGPKTWKGGDTIRYRCDYTNPDSTEVFQGPNAQTSEMCVFAGLYYPKQDAAFENCDRTSFSGFGTKSCTSVASCIEACPAADALQFTATGASVGPCWERCIASGCDGATDDMLPLVTCASNTCASECKMGTAACISCATSKCTTEFDTCSSQTCK